ncbi:MAG: type III polyketide synthase [Planctomycetes bacterium]|nr:type III polyketide synthase [Planctomycetota bacterium]
MESAVRRAVPRLSSYRALPDAEVPPLRIAAAATAFPPHWYAQRELTERLVQLLGVDPRVAERLRSLHEHSGIDGRHLWLPLEAYSDLGGFTGANRAWLDGALTLGERSCREALAQAGVRADEVDAIFFSTVTGLASPSIDARLVTRLGLRPDVKRVPMFGLGCVAGAAAVSRAADYVSHRPDAVALVLTVELCSLTLQPEDRSVANLISVGLFGDGAAAAVVVGEDRSDPGNTPRVVDTRSVFYPDTEHVMGWDIGAHGFRIVLSAEVPDVARDRLPLDVDAFLADHGMTRRDVACWVAHPGGPKVLEGLQEGLGVGRDALAISWDSLRRAGNLSSASVLMILAETLRQRRFAPGARGVMLAMGPGFCSELLLLEW